MSDAVNNKQVNNDAAKNWSLKVNRAMFEGYYIVKFMFEVEFPVKQIKNFRNNNGGYDDPHIDGAWQIWKHCKK